MCRSTELESDWDGHRGETIRTVHQHAPAPPQLMEHQSQASSETAVEWMLLAGLNPSTQRQGACSEPPSDQVGQPSALMDFSLRQGCCGVEDPWGTAYYNPETKFGREGLSRKDHQTEDGCGYPQNIYFKIYKTLFSKPLPPQLWIYSMISQLSAQMCTKLPMMEMRVL